MTNFTTTDFVILYAISLLLLTIGGGIGFSTKPKAVEAKPAVCIFAVVAAVFFLPVPLNLWPIALLFGVLIGHLIRLIF